MKTVLRVLLIAALVASIASGAVAQRSGRRPHSDGAVQRSDRKPTDNDKFLESVLKTNRELRCKGRRKVVTWSTGRDGKKHTRSFTERITRDRAKIWTEYSDNEEMDGQIAVDDGRQRFHYFPKLNVIHRMPSLAKANNSRLERMIRDPRSSFTITVSGGGKIARKDTRLIELSSKTGYSHKIWVDKKGLAILKHEAVSLGRGRGMSYEFVWLRYLNTIDPKEFELDLPGVPILDPKDRLRVEAKKLKMNSFSLTASSKFELREASGSESDTGRKVLRSVYGDGRVVVTLVQIKGTPMTARPRGRINVYTWKSAGFNFALIGDLPPSELKRLSKLVRQ